MKEPPKKSGEPKIKWVNISKSFCITFWHENKQCQEWIEGKEKAIKRLEELKIIQNKI